MFKNKKKFNDLKIYYFEKDLYIVYRKHKPKKKIWKPFETVFDTILDSIEPISLDLDPLITDDWIL